VHTRWHQRVEVRADDEGGLDAKHDCASESAPDLIPPLRYLWRRPDRSEGRGEQSERCDRTIHPAPAGLAQLR
jgi:hypothetical protein